jgi:hypothetical protein
MRLRSQLAGHPMPRDLHYRFRLKDNRTLLPRAVAVATLTLALDRGGGLGDLPWLVFLRERCLRRLRALPTRGGWRRGARR